MACNFLPTRVLDINKNSDTLSEASECGTTTSEWTSNWDSKEELRDLLSKLGLKEVSDLHQERFRVDRKKLEQMLTGDNEALIPADVFFAKIMEDTDTYITWPNKLKIGAKSKKDPHVRIAGRPEDVKAAKERIVILLDTKCNRITMKMDVSYTDHSHIIGKGGLSIKRVMEETQCHVHFPDSNRSNPTEKSNQVSISGDINGVEGARSRVRELIPLIFGFELPIMTQNIDATSLYIVKIQEQYNVQVMFKTRPKLHATLVLVKGVEWEVDSVKHATTLLMEYMCENLANQIPVQMSMEISPHHHQVVLGKNHSNLKTIMQYTNCQIMFPDAQDPNIPNLKKSNVNISGNINDVYKARQLLMGSLPLIIIFDLPEESTILRTRQDQIADIQTNYDVTITIRQKAKQNTRACVIKGVEKNAGNIYKARSYILGFDEPCTTADIPPSYHLPQSLATPPIAQSANPSLSLPPQNTSNMHPISPVVSPLLSPSWPHPATPTGQNGPPFVGLMKQPQFVYNMSHQSMGSSGYHSINQTQFTASSLVLEQSGEVSNYSPISSNNSSFSSNSPRNSGSPYHRQYMEPQNQRNDLSSVLSEMNFSPGYHGTSVDRRQDKNNLVPIDLENKRMAGYRAMQNKAVTGSYRQPTNSWSGYYISHTSPTPLVDTLRQKKEEEVWNTPPKRTNSYSNISAALNTSNILEHTPSHVLNNLISSDWPDLPTMLTSLGLERYINLFTTHEIDLMIFSTLTDKDLIEIGINTFGVRRKILLAISELNRRSSSFSAAPGAERKNSPSKMTNTYQPANETKW
ncbi:protein bicaudal C [Diabrotica virgifera virgifera]|uniref:Protein bicaudal C n=1 Tax=Diabrotica virgifera virgifera TaxID=50390 RepID=A0A6P7F4L3_DIAVI|nr:protein bicaudal C [Diabrotica virgifera virgifera]